MCIYVCAWHWLFLGRGFSWVFLSLLCIVECVYILPVCRMHWLVCVLCDHYVGSMLWWRWCPIVWASVVTVLSGDWGVVWERFVLWPLGGRWK
jgi:hypothetical protein